MKPPSRPALPRRWPALLLALLFGTGCAGPVAGVASAAEAGGNWSSPSVTRTRQVEHRARPPHTAACGMRFARLMSSSDRPRGATTVGPSA